MAKRKGMPSHMSVRKEVWQRTVMTDSQLLVGESPGMEEKRSERGIEIKKAKHLVRERERES